ncbi:hypothetical protein LLEC1_04027 [Akanthomyces lecanii]|uniref:Uncharacterized protein n=1 Tax=Cordyceps confragosa TaxID=2714763 RepID=A0A179IBB2_CORDF|nr:hypothetical protein LLEC1_04027 [Akanthomyces lecanii]
MSGHYHTAGYAMPIHVPGKGNQYPAYSQYSMSPPDSLNAKAARKHPKEYAKACARLPSPEC